MLRTQTYRKEINYKSGGHYECKTQRRVAFAFKGSKREEIGDTKVKFLKFSFALEIMVKDPQLSLRYFRFFKKIQ